MKRILRWIKGAWFWLFADVRTEMRKDSAQPPEEKGGEDDSE